jgi:opacity protein-like surface antigen
MALFYQEYEMKRVLTACVAAAIFASLPLISQAATQPPNAQQMAPLQYLVGTWHCTWTAGKDTGAEDQVFESALYGAWLQEKEVVVNASGQSVVQSIHYTGYDPENASYMHVGPDASGAYEIARSPDGNVWHDANGGGAFVHTKVSDTQRTMSEEYQSGGKSVKLVMTCTKAP